MANRRFNQFYYSLHSYPVVIDVDIPIGATGAVGTIAGAGVSSVTRLNTGIYRVKFQDNYNRYLGSYIDVWSPNNGSTVNAGSFSTNTVYVITTVGNTNWTAIGLPTGLTAAVGMSFKASGAGSGTGVAATPIVSGIAAIEIVGSPNTELAPNAASSTRGAYVTFQTLAATNSSTTTLIATDPASGSTISCAFYLDNSSNALLNNG